MKQPRRGWRVVLGIVLAGATAGCGAAGQATGPAAPTAPPRSGSEPLAAGPAPAARPAGGPATDPWAVPEAPRDDAPVAAPPAAFPVDDWTRATKVTGLAAVPKECAAFASRAPARPTPPDLVTALAESDAAKRDALLAGRDEKEAPGLVRALRAELAPVECADAIVDPVLKGPSASAALSAKHGHVLVGLSLAAKLARTAHAPPTLPGNSDKETVKKFVLGPLRAWVLEQATAIETLGSGATRLAGYGRGIAAIEAGHADLRLVDQLRSAPTPKSWDAEIRGVYEAALDEALEPRKTRGRDAVLVGLADMADTGVLRDARVTRARALLAKLYGGSRVDALDRLLLPETPLPMPTTPLGRAAAAVPVFWIDTLGGPFDAVASGDDPAWSAVLGRGVPRGTRAKLRASLGDAKPEVASAYARARLDLGRVSYRRIDFVEAAHAAKRAGAQQGDRLVLALAITLASGPNGARALMTSPQASTAGLAETAALDALVAEGGTSAGFAAYDSAFLRAMAAVDAKDAPARLLDVSKRYQKAASLLPPPLAKVAQAHAADAEAAAKIAGGGK